MPELDGNKSAKDFGIGVPQATQGYYLKGSAHLEWGMKDRLSRVFQPASGKTVMLAFDHGYIMGPTSGLERMDLTITPLMEYADWPDVHPAARCGRSSRPSTTSPFRCDTPPDRPY